MIVGVEFLTDSLKLKQNRNMQQNIRYQFVYSLSTASNFV